MASPIQRLAKLSSKVFGGSPNDVITKDALSPIANTLNDLKADDLNFSLSDIAGRDAVSYKRKVAPVTFMNVCQHPTFTMAVFVVKPGSGLPLHDHPRMFGLLKVIAGSVKITSYSKVEDQALSEPSIVKQLELKGLEGASRNIITVEQNEDKDISETDNCCILTPSEGNFHEIKANTDIAAFLDILAPPYGSDHDCHYYEELYVRNSNQSNIKWLIEVPQPRAYWCDVIKYKGPSLDFADIFPDG